MDIAQEILVIGREDRPLKRVIEILTATGYETTTLPHIEKKSICHIKKMDI